jgi:hypothetical protein
MISPFSVTAGHVRPLNVSSIRIYGSLHCISISEKKKHYPALVSNSKWAVQKTISSRHFVVRKDGRIKFAWQGVTEMTKRAPSGIGLISRFGLSLPAFSP